MDILSQSALITSPPKNTLSHRLKVLISVYSVEPDAGSEPGVGWNVIQEMSRYHDIWVIARMRQHGEDARRQAIERALEKQPMPNVHWTFYELPGWMRKLVKVGSNYSHYYLWQMGAYFKVRELHQKIGFDLSHHVTYVRYWSPSFIALLPIPFVWGPVGGGETTPSRLYSTLSPSGRRYERVRDLARTIFQADPFVRLTAKRAKIGLATTPETETELRKLGCKNTQVMSQVALPTAEIHQIASQPPREDNTFRLLSLGRLLDWKGFHLGLQAFARFLPQHPNSEYWIIGDGPQRAYLEALADELGIRQHMRFWGNLNRDEVMQRMGECDVLVHPSLHDSGGGVCLEAMAARRPVICLDLGGPGLQVTPETGFKIRPDSPEQILNDLVSAMTTLAADPELRRRMGHAAHQHVASHYTWYVRGAELATIYRDTAIRSRQQVVQGEYS